MQPSGAPTTHPADETLVDYERGGVSLSHLSHTLRAYSPAILITLASILLLYGIFAVLYYLVAPSQRIVSLPFRLEFEGAKQGEYPNATKFTTAEITATPILQKVFTDNDLKRFTTFPRFTRSIFVLDANRGYENLAREYQAKLTDPRLSSIDRERIEREFILKRESLSKAEYSINFLIGPDTTQLPASIVDKTLSDVLAGWANYAAVRKGALLPRVPALSLNILDKGSIETSDYIVALSVLRSKITKIMANIDEITTIPGAELARTASKKASLAEIRIRLEDLIRFRIQPLSGFIRQAGVVKDFARTQRILGDQLTYDERELAAAEARTKVLTDALHVYTQERIGVDRGNARQETAASDSGRETVMPQISDSFLDKLVALTTQNADREYRQKMVDEIKEAGLAEVPLRTAIAYDRELLETVRRSTGSGSGSPENRALVEREFDALFKSVEDAIRDVNEVYQTIASNLNPATELFAPTEAPSRRTERNVSLPRLALYGILVFLLSIPLVAGAALLHNRIREEEALEEM